MFDCLLILTKAQNDHSQSLLFCKKAKNSFVTQ